MSKTMIGGIGALVLVCAVSGLAWAAANQNDRSRSNPYPPVIAMPGTGDDFQLSSRGNIVITVNVPGALPRDARQRYIAYVDAVLAQFKTDLVKDFETKHKLTNHGPAQK